MLKLDLIPYHIYNFIIDFFILDTVTQTISLALYRHVLLTIVGSENQVKTTRLMNAARDNMTSNAHINFITSGSYGEGLEMRGSDLDLLYVSKSIEVYENFRPALNTNVIYLSMERDDVKPCFTQLLVDQTDPQVLSELLEEFNGKHYVSSLLFKKEGLHEGNIDHAVHHIHGPCISDKNNNYDHALCLHCKTWISQASQWITRSSTS